MTKKANKYKEEIRELRKEVDDINSFIPRIIKRQNKIGNIQKRISDNVNTVMVLIDSILDEATETNIFPNFEAKFKLNKEKAIKQLEEQSKNEG